MNRIRVIVYHISVWFIYICYEVFILLRIDHAGAPWLALILFYSLNIGLFYAHAYATLPFVYRSRYKTAAIGVLVLVELMVYNLLSVFFDILVTSWYKGHWMVNIVPLDFVRSTWRGLYFLFLSSGYFFVLRSIKSARQEAILENQTLRAQINPHLLYNMLNYIYSSVLGTAPRTAEAITLLADSMRYAMAPAEQDGMVPLAKELEHIVRYVEMYRIKFNDRLLISVILEEDCHGLSLRVPPLLLMTFVENMFKHGNLIEETGIIKASAEKGWLCFYTQNRKSNKRAIFSNGIGLENARARLQKYFNGKFILDASENEGNFIVDLKLKL